MSYEIEKCLETDRLYQTNWIIEIFTNLVALKELEFYVNAFFSKRTLQDKLLYPFSYIHLV